MSFSDTEEDAICINDDEKSEYDVVLEKLKTHFVENKLTYQCLEDTAKLMNSMPGAIIQIPTTKYLLLKAFMPSNSSAYKYYIHCEKCKTYVKCLPDNTKTDKWKCENLRNNIMCGQKLMRCAKNYFVYMNLEPQLRQILEKHWDAIVDYNNQIQSDMCENLCDAYSGTFVQNSLQKKVNVLSLMINSDGISLKKSGSSSVWPLQVICNFLPPKIRYRLENILCVSFYYQKQKPDMLDFCEPFAEEVDRLQARGFVFRQRVFKAAITSAVLDLPAKASFQQLTQYNGYFSCGYCLQKGEKTAKGVRYTWNDELPDIRTNDSFILAMHDISSRKNGTKDGVKGVSPAVAFDYFDLVKSFGLDYMHSVCLGVMKNLHDFWMDSKKAHDSYIVPEHQRALDKRIVSIKPCVFISRLPRSLKYFGKYKASEIRSLLLYYFPVALRGILKKKYLEHFLLLSGSIYQLLTTNISKEDILTVDNNLKQFVREYQELYGKENMTMNVHLMSHMVFCVKNLGPLWTQSMYAFESNNATFSRYVKGNNDVIAELGTRYMLHKSLSREAYSIPKNANEFEYKKKKILTASEVSALSAVLRIPVANNKMFQTYCVYKKNEERFTSEYYSIAKRTIDYVVELKNKVMGKVKFYFECEGVFYLLLEHYECVCQTQHIHEIKPKNIESVYPAVEIEKKFIYINFFNKHYITERPNLFESD